eukprot:scaffold159135_cov21-Prasinocladus_malaysianus.AAC.1
MQAAALTQPACTSLRKRGRPTLFRFQSSDNTIFSDLSYIPTDARTTEPNCTVWSVYSTVPSRPTTIGRIISYDVEAGMEAHEIIQDSCANTM